jgi:hypothetical protein
LVFGKLVFLLEKFLIQGVDISNDTLVIGGSTSSRCKFSEMYTEASYIYALLRDPRTLAGSPSGTVGWEEMGVI